jgi:FeS assembly SUF system protein
MEPSSPSRDEIEQSIIEVLRTVYDPEIPVDIYELGLIYEIELDDSQHLRIRMTLTAPGCPVAGHLVEEVRRKVLSISGVADADVELVWDPPWDQSMMSEAARLALGF